MLCLLTCHVRLLLSNLYTRLPENKLNFYLDFHVVQLDFYIARHVHLRCKDISTVVAMSRGADHSAPRPLYSGWRPRNIDEMSRVGVSTFRVHGSRPGMGRGRAKYEDLWRADPERANAFFFEQVIRA